MVFGFPAGARPVCTDFRNIRAFFQEFPVFLIQMNLGAFLITYLSPDALAAFRLASPGAFAGRFRRQFYDLNWSRVGAITTQALTLTVRPLSVSNPLFHCPGNF
jgi:hypothetical protein